MVVDILAPLRMRRRCWGAFISTPYCRAAPTRVSATNLEPAGQLQFLIRTGIVKYAKSESHLYIIESYKTSRPLFRHGGGSAGDNSRSPSFIYTRSIQINIFFFNVASVFVFIYLCPIFKTVLVYTHGSAIAALTLLYTIPDSFWPASWNLKIDVSCRCVYLRLDFEKRKKEKRNFALVKTK